MTSLNPKINSVSRDRLYYDVYEYCVYFLMQDVSAIKLEDHKKIDEYISHQEWRRKINYGGSWQIRSFRRPITPSSIKKCHNAHDKLKEISEDYKLITSSYDYGYLYIKNLNSAVNFLSSPGITILQIKKVVVDRPKNTLIIKSAKHNLRTYFRNQRIEMEQKQNLIAFLDSRTDIRLGPAMQDWITKFPNQRYVCDNYFIDHNDDGFLMLLALVSSIKIKKTLTLLTE